MDNFYNKIGFNATNYLNYKCAIIITIIILQNQKELLYEIVNK